MAINDFLKKQQIKKIILFMASVTFAIGFAYAIYSSPELLKSIDYKQVSFIVLLGVPCTLLLNAVDFILLGHVFFKPVPFIRALEISILSSAANMLPLPGGTITKIAGLKQEGVGIGKASGVTIIFGFIWISVAFIYAGISLFFYSSTTRAIGLTLLAGGAILLIFLIIVLRIHNKSNTLILAIILHRFTLVFVDALRLFWSFNAINSKIDLLQSGIFVISGVLGSVVSIIPAGLGIREGVSALLAPTVGLSASSGFIATSINRLLGLTVLSPLAFLLSYRKTN